MDNLLKWNEVSYVGGHGIVTGCDERQEWMLKWWWNHYSQTNTLPVTFLDYGLSASARAWCKKRMQVVSFSLPDTLMKDKEPFPLPEKWPQKWQTDIINQRKIWFTKALSLLKTPYEKTLWVDLDCKFLTPVDDIFSTCDNQGGLALTLDVPETTRRWKDVGFLSQNAKGYQVGVILYKRHSSLMNKWAKNCVLKHKIEYSEQTSLNHTLEEENLPVALLSQYYNWLDAKRVHPDAKIVHYGGEEHKIELVKELQLL